MNSTSQNISRLTGRLLKNARDQFQRRCIVFSGSRAWCHNNLENIFRANMLEDAICVSTIKPDFSHCKIISAPEALKFLGHEFQHAVIDYHDGIDPNLLGAISGTVCGGGLLILLLPPVTTLTDFPDPERKRMCIWPYSADDVGKRFLERFRNILTTTSEITLIVEGQQLPAITECSNKVNLDGYNLENECRTTDQQQAVDAVMHVVNGHRRRPLVITASRGRGKSAALGIAAARLILQGTSRIIVTGPRLSSTAVVFEHAQRLIPDVRCTPGKIMGDTGSLEYLAPDVLCRDTPECNLLLVDEAAAIPVNMLTRLLKTYARIGFATTTYGYEGTGRGFTIKFQETLTKETPSWRALEMKLPIRWAPSDPVETFVFSSLCLNAEVNPVQSPVDPSQIAIEKIDRDTLINDEKLLSEIFGLLVLAHYQTQPRDLRYLLDGLDLDIFAARINDQLTGIAVVEQEGGLDENTAHSVYRNERRVTGHLLPQTLESFVGVRLASTSRYLRIVRIAVHPDLRRVGIGHKILSHIEFDAKSRQVDIIGSNFGASSELLPFWQNAGYSPVHIGIKHNTSTGTNAATVLKPVQDKGLSVCETATHKFRSQFSFQLAEAYQNLDSDIVAGIYNSIAISSKLRVTNSEWEDVTSFSNSLRGYEINSLPINKITHHCFINGHMNKLCEKQEIDLLIKKVLQRQSWQNIVSSLGFDGKQQAIDALRKTIKKLVSHNTIKESIEIAPNP